MKNNSKRTIMMTSKNNVVMRELNDNIGHKIAEII